MSETVQIPVVTFTIEDLIDKVRELANNSPDNTYFIDDKSESLGCSYTSGTCGNNSVGCIFGQALVALGCPLGFLSLVDQGFLMDPYGYKKYEISVILNNLGIKITHEQSKWCSLIQCEQDSGVKWGKCLKIADETVELA